MKIRLNISLKYIFVLGLIFQDTIVFSQNLLDHVTFFTHSGKNQIVKIAEMDFNKIISRQSLKLASLDYRLSQPNYNKKIPFNDYKLKIFTSIYFYGQKENERWDVYGPDDKRVFKKDFIDILNLGNELFLVRNDDDIFGVINIAGKTIVPFNYKYIHKEWGFLIGYRSDGQEEILTLEGKSIFKGKIKYGDEYIEQNNLYGILTKKYFVPPILDFIHYYNEYNDLLSFSSSGSKGLVYREKIYFPLEHDNISFIGNYIELTEKEKKLYYDFNMNQIFSKNYSDYVYNNSDSSFFVKLNDKWLWLDWKGNRINNEEYIIKPTFFRTSRIYGNVYYIINGEEKLYFNKKNNFPKLSGIKDLYAFYNVPHYFAQKKDSAEILNRFLVKIGSGKYTDAIGFNNKILLKDGQGKYCVMDTFGRVSNFDFGFEFIEAKSPDKKLITQQNDIKYYKSNGKFGLEIKGKWTVPFIDRINYDHYNDFLIFESNQLIGLITSDTLLFPTMYRSFLSEDNLIRAEKYNGFFDLLDMKGKIIMQNLKPDYRLSKSYGVKDGTPIFYKTDLDGNLIKVENLKFISQIYSAFIVEQNGMQGLLDEELKLIIDTKFKVIESFYYHSKSYLKVKTNDNKYGLYDQKGAIVLDPIYDQITKQSDKVAVKIDGKEVDFNRLLKREKYNELFID